MDTEAHAIQLRKAGPADAHQFAVLAESLFRDAFAASNDPLQLNAYCAGSFSADIQGQQLQTPGMSVFFVEVAGRVAGLLQVEVTGDVAFLHRFYVHPVWHGRGIAQQMMEYCIEVAHAAGAHVLRLATWEENGRAIAFYRKYGFAVVGEQPFVLGTEIQNDYVMERRISEL